MAYKCPRCGDPVHRGYSGGAQATAGLVGALFYAAFGSFQCKKCGKILRSEFPPEVRAKMAAGSLIMIVVAIAVLVAAMWLISMLD